MLSLIKLENVKSHGCGRGIRRECGCKVIHRVVRVGFIGEVIIQETLFSFVKFSVVSENVYLLGRELKRK